MITAADISAAQALYAQFSKMPVPTSQLRAMAGGNADAVKLIDLHEAISARVSSAAQITEPVLTDAIKAAGLTVTDVRGKMNSCPMGGKKPALPKS